MSAVEDVLNRGDNDIRVAQVQLVTRAGLGEPALGPALAELLRDLHVRGVGAAADVVGTVALRGRRDQDMDDSEG